MTQLNLSQITDKLNQEFAGEGRRLIFWYDEKADFAEDIDTLDLANAKVFHLQKDNQFFTKYFLEWEDTETNYLIYAPFAKPPVRENHLADTIHYSKEFFADRASLLALDLGIEEQYKPVLQEYMKFFQSKERAQKFYDLGLVHYDRKNIETGLLSVLSRAKTASFEEVARIVLSEEDLEENKCLAEFDRFGLTESFWQFCEETFGYRDSKPSLSKLAASLFLTYMDRVIGHKLPQALNHYLLPKQGSVIVFLDSLMNSVLYIDAFDRLSEKVFRDYQIESALDSLPAENCMHLALFRNADVHMIQWATERLLAQDTEAKAGDLDILGLCRYRQKMHFGEQFRSHYCMLENAYHLISAANFTPKTEAEELYKSYLNENCLLDSSYRYFCYHYDRVENNAPYEKLREMVENIYTNRFLSPLAVAWSRAFKETQTDTGLPKQQEFYSRYVKNSKERTIVIISDALRYEVGKILMEKLSMDEKYTAEISAMQSILPSYTRLGMAALLPHRTLELDENYTVLADGRGCDDLKGRLSVLQSYCPAGAVSQFDSIRTVKDARELTTGRDVVYLYHNQIDARGDKSNTEDEVFAACEEAIEEIMMMIRRLASANNTRFVITADHGFLYKRGDIRESDKITVPDRKGAFAGKRYVIAEEPAETAGMVSIPLGKILGSSDSRAVSLPMGIDIIKTAGGGQHYVHGGMSLQEMMIPVIEVKAAKGAQETRSAAIAMVSLVHKVTNLNMNLEFIQSEPVSDVVKEATYSLYFTDENGQKISSENICTADRRDEDAGRRMFRFRFAFKNQAYDRDKNYYLLVVDRKTGLEVLRHEVKMDLAFADDFGFDI